MYAILTQEQYTTDLPQEAKDFVGYTAEILEAAGFANGAITPQQCIVGNKILLNDGRIAVSLSLSNANKLPRLVALHEPDEPAIKLWAQLVGDENIITEEQLNNLLQ